jgi:hypothetical protein
MRIVSQFVFLSAASCFGQAVLDAPQAALVLDRAGGLRPLNGMSQNFLLGDPLMDGVLSLACSSARCLLKTESSIVGIDGSRVDAPPGPALISLARSEAALFYFRSQHQFAWYRDGTLQPLDWDQAGEVLAIRARGEGADIAIRREDGVWIVRETGAIERSLPDEVVAVLFAGNRILYTTASRLIVEQEDGTSLSFDLPGATALSLLNDRYAQVSATSGDYILRLDPGREQLSLLPQPTETAP